MKCSNFEIFITDYIDNLEIIISKFEQLKTNAKDHHYKCNIAKTAGTTVSGTGVALVIGSVITMPFTGGSSLIMGAGGAVMSVTGSLSNVITDYIDYKSSTMIMQDIQDILKNKEDFNKSLQKQLDNLQAIIDKLVESGIDKDTAIVTAIQGVSIGCIDLTEEPNMNLMNTLSTIIKLHHIEGAALETLPIIGKTFHISEKSFQFIYNILGLTGKSAPHIIKTIGRISSLVSITFTVIDVAILIRDWSAEHPSVEVIQEAQKKIEEEKMILEDLLQVIRASRDRESALSKAIEDIKIVEDEDDLLKDYEVIWS